MLLLNVKIDSTKILILDFLLQNIFFSIFFTYFCLMISINGANFIDGLNGLSIGYFIIIMFFVAKLGLTEFYGLNQFQFYFLLYICIVILIFNYLDQIYLGDSGAYLLSFMTSYFLIEIYSNRPALSPFFIILLLWYPCFENLFSILRKIKFKKSAAEPDTKHFHQLLFYYFAKTLKLKKIYINNFTSIIINIFNIMIFFIGSKFLTKTNIQIALISVSLITYLYLYFLLFNYRYKKIK